MHYLWFVGVFGFPHCPAVNSTLCEYVRKLLDYGAYIRLVVLCEVTYRCSYTWSFFNSNFKMCPMWVADKNINRLQKFHNWRFDVSRKDPSLELVLPFYPSFLPILLQESTKRFTFHQQFIKNIRKHSQPVARTFLGHKSF